MKIIDNNTELLRDNLISSIKKGSKMSIAASCFSMYAFNELIEQLKGLDEFRFIFTTPSFVNNDKHNMTVQVTLPVLLQMYLIHMFAAQITTFVSPVNPKMQRR